MASLPPRKRPWHDGPGTSDHREMDAPGGPPEERGKGKKSLILKTLRNTGTFFNSSLTQNFFKKHKLLTYTTHRDAALELNVAECFLK